jgi:hypothetical protein
MSRPGLHRAKFNNYIKTNASNSASKRHLITIRIFYLQSFVGGLWLGLDVTLASEARITHHFFFKKLASQTSFGPWIIWFMLDLACNALNPVSVERHKKEKSTHLLLYSSLSINFWRKWSLFSNGQKGCLWWLDASPFFHIILTTSL